jgi:hypothetical protein
MKGRLWCAHLPTVTVPRAAAPKSFTLVMPYYCNPEFLETQLEGWWGLPPAVRERMTAVIVDDGSPIGPAAGVLRRQSLPFPIRLFRIDVDVRWNWLAARNIGLHYAAPGWVLVTDMDHVVPAATARAVIEGEHAPGVIYAFSRVEHTGAPATPHSASFLLTRAMFWKVGGYDERLSGYYGTDGDWRRRCAATAPMEVLTDPLVRHEFVQDSSTTRYRRKQLQDAAVRPLIAARGKQWTPRTLSFPYHEVALTEAAVCR